MCIRDRQSGFMGKKKDVKKKLEKVEKAAKAQKKELKEAAKLREQAEREARAAAQQAREAREKAAAAKDQAARAQEQALEGPSEELLAEAAGAIEPGATPFSDALRVDTGFRLEEVDPRSTPAFTGNKVQGKLAMAASNDELDELPVSYTHLTLPTNREV